MIWIIAGAVALVSYMIGSLNSSIIISRIIRIIRIVTVIRSYLIIAVSYA